MALMTGQQYLESIRKMRPNIYKFGELIEDVTTHPSTKLLLNWIAQNYDACFDPEKKDVFTTKSYLSGEIAHRWNTLATTVQDQIDNTKMKRAQFNWTGMCAPSTCAGWTALNVLWAVTYDMDQEYGTVYHDRLKNYFKYVEDNSLALCGALTDAKGNRSLAPSQQDNKMLFLHVKEVREDGVVISGYKTMICGIASCHEIICVPGTGYKESDADCCIAVAVPRDAEGVTIVETRSPSDKRYYEEEDSWDVPRAASTTASYIIFEDVFVPNERVFMCKEHKHSGKIAAYFSAIYRSAIGGCVSGQGDVIVGASLNMARANGLSRKTFQQKLTQMAINNEITYGLGIGAISEGTQHPSGVWLPDPLLAHVNKTQVAYLPFDTKVLAQDISGGIVESGCAPSAKDCKNPQYGKHIMDALQAGCSGESRIKMARLLEWFVAGGGLSACLHGGGSPDSAKLVVNGMTKWEEYAQLAKDIVGVTEELVDFKK